MLSCGPATLAPLAAAPRLSDEYAVAIHPAVLATGPWMFEELAVDLALAMVEARIFEAGAVGARYRVNHAQFL